MKSWHWQALGAVAILALGYGIGRYAQPAKVVERDRIVETVRDSSLTWHAYVGRTETKTQTKVATKTITRWERDGSVSQVTQAATEASTETRSTVATNEGKATQHEAAKEETHERAVEAKRFDWTATARAGVSLKDGTPVYGADISRRIIGSLSAGVWVLGSGLDRDGASAGAALSFAW